MSCELATKIVFDAASRMLDLVGVAFRSGYRLPDGDIETSMFLLSWSEYDDACYRVAVDIRCGWDERRSELEEAVTALLITPWIKEVRYDEGEMYDPARVTFAILVQKETLSEVAHWLRAYWCDKASMRFGL